MDTRQPDVLVAPIKEGLTYLVEESFRTSSSKGWHESIPSLASTRLMLADPNLPVSVRRTVADRLAALLFMVTDEVHEAGDHVRKPPDLTEEGGIDRFVDLVTGELADIIIRTADIAGWLGGDLAEAVTNKLVANRDRPYRHGNKLL